MANVPEEIVAQFRRNVGCWFIVKLHMRPW